MDGVAIPRINILELGHRRIVSSSVALPSHLRAIIFVHDQWSH
jgi:hypothetical protein